MSALSNSNIYEYTHAHTHSLFAVLYTQSHITLVLVFRIAFGKTSEWAKLFCTLTLWATYSVYTFFFLQKIERKNEKTVTKDYYSHSPFALPPPPPPPISSIITSTTIRHCHHHYHSIQNVCVCKRFRRVQRFELLIRRI